MVAGELLSSLRREGTSLLLRLSGGEEVKLTFHIQAVELVIHRGSAVTPISGYSANIY